MSGSALSVEGVSFTYPDGQRVLDALSLAIEHGERIALLGPNGAGKTTFALHLNGILELQDGAISVDGLELTARQLPEIRRRVGMVFQNADDQLFMPTVREDVAFGPSNLGLRGDELDERVERALRAVDAHPMADRAPHHLSGGEKRRVAIATVLAMDPSMLVLDEPTSGLDPAGRRELLDLLDSLALTQLIVTHDLPFALELCPRSIVLSDGRVVADGPTAELLADTELLAANRLELPFGFDPRTLRQRPDGELSA
ncbi:MAG: ABC transporter ATP-binding protein [Actinomycetota bacterium]